MDFYFSENKNTGKWPDMLFNIIPDATLISLLVLMYMFSIRLAVLCVILVGFVIVGKKPAFSKDPSTQKYVSGWVVGRMDGEINDLGMILFCVTAPTYGVTQQTANIVPSQVWCSCIKM